LIYKNPKIGFDLQVAGVYTGERISFISPYAGLNYWQSPMKDHKFILFKLIKEQGKLELTFKNKKLKF
jgi:hypothetical protein